MSNFNEVPQDIKGIVKDRIKPFFESDIKSFDEVCKPIMDDLEALDLIDHIKAIFVENVDIYDVLSSADSNVFKHITQLHLEEAKRLSNEKKEIVNELKEYQTQGLSEEEIIEKIGERCKKYRIEASLLSSENLYYMFKQNLSQVSDMFNNQ